MKQITISEKNQKRKTHRMTKTEIQQAQRILRLFETLYKDLEKLPEVEPKISLKTKRLINENVQSQSETEINIDPPLIFNSIISSPWQNESQVLIQKRKNNKTKQRKIQNPHIRKPKQKKK